jgi:hypothetical protein
MVPIGTWRDEHGMSIGWTWDGWWDELVMGYSWDIWGRNWIFSWDMCDDTLVTSVTWMICMIFLINPLLNDLILFFFESPWIRKSKEAIQFYKDVLQYTANVATWQFWQWAANVSYVSNVGLWERLVVHVSRPTEMRGCRRAALSGSNETPTCEWHSLRGKVKMHLGRIWGHSNTSVS